jgi:hypothetical protein
MPMLMLDRPGADEYAPYYARYISLVPAGDLVFLMTQQIAEVVARLRVVSPATAAYRYAPDKWSVRDVLGHLIDTERVFTYRAIAFARGDTASLPSFDQDVWAAGADADHRLLPDLLDEWVDQRRATIAMARGLPGAALHRTGVASGVTFTVRALLHIPHGHVAYHLQHLTTAYGVG